jgi:hypothetical protein
MIFDKHGLPSTDGGEDLADKIICQVREAIEQSNLPYRVHTVLSMSAPYIYISGESGEEYTSLEDCPEQLRTVLESVLHDHCENCGTRIVRLGRGMTACPQCGWFNVAEEERE